MIYLYVAEDGSMENFTKLVELIVYIINFLRELFNFLRELFNRNKTS